MTDLRNNLDFFQTSTDLGGVTIYSGAIATWVDPVPSLPPEDGRLFPWNYPVPVLPPTLPSGNPYPKISVVTVTYNQGEYLEETLRSVLLQGYPNLEYIVLDGSSTDQTSQILERYRSELTYCVSEPDKGQSDALNKGFRRATGDILAWLNSDDCYLPWTLLRVAIAFDTYGTDMIVGGCQMRRGNSRIPFKVHHSALPLNQKVTLPLERLLDIDNCWQQGEFFYQPEVFWTRELWQRAGGRVREDLYYSMDYELWVRMAQQGATVTHIIDPLVQYRVHPDQKTYGADAPYVPELKSVAAQFRSA